MKVTIPRVELLGAVIAVRLAKKIQETVLFGFSAGKFLTDLSCVLGMLKCDSLYG